ncbi:hypothetical protein M0813_09649 [Anaeramoeba flamelloides]|uniref:Transposase n=1 Tax=Anaeramoeba flamelloides TaxID=1746091 RepID=A0ABQ8X5R2_9EUKA|nr:hypothetical protein M0813_09649 [Anaeramoeba flamelloides]
MLTNQKPFPGNINPTFVCKNGWVLKKKTQIFKNVCIRGKKIVICCWHGKYCQKTHTRRYYPKKHGGKIHHNYKKKRKKRHKKEKKNLYTKRICLNCYNLWRDWNRAGSPKLKQEWEIEREKIEMQKFPVLSDTVSPSTDYGSDPDFSPEQEDIVLHSPPVPGKNSFTEQEWQEYLIAESLKADQMKKEQKEKEEKEQEEKEQEGKQTSIEQIKKKFKPNEKQILRQKSLESGKAPLKPKIDELETPHSAYLVDSQQMILLLKNVHCECGKKKKLNDLKQIFGSFKAELICKNCSNNNGNDSIKSFYFSKKLDQRGGNEKKVFKREIGQRKIVASVLAGNFFENYREQMEMLGLCHLKKTAYYRTIAKLMEETNCLFQEHLDLNRSKMDLQNLVICIDAGWSSRGHYANECAFIIIDDKTGLLFDLIVVTRESFSGPSGNMEAEAARIFCEKHKNTIKLISVVKDGDTKLAEIFKCAWKRVTVLQDLNHLLKNVSKTFEKNEYKCIKETGNPIRQWMRAKIESSWSSLELKIQIKLSFFHFLNHHEVCEHKKKTEDKYDFPKLNILEKQFLIEIIREIRDDINKYLVLLRNNLKKIETKIINGYFTKKDKKYWFQICDQIQEKIDFLI